MNKDPHASKERLDREPLDVKELFDFARRVSFNGKSSIGHAALNNGMSSLENPGGEVTLVGRNINESWDLCDMGIDSIYISYLPRRLGNNGVSGETVMVEVNPLLTTSDAGSTRLFKLQEENDAVMIDYVIVNDKQPQGVWSKATTENLAELQAILQATESESDTSLATP